MKSYYRCSICHSKIIFEVPGDGSDTIIRCSAVGCMLDKSRIYRCVNYHWWELLYLSVRTIFRSIKESWRTFLQYEKDCKAMDKIIKEWRKK